MSEEQIVNLVEEAKKPGKFNIVSVLKERAYPSIDVDVYLDESKAFEASQISEKIKDAELQVARKTGGPADAARKRVDGFKAELEAIKESIADSKYVFTISGISEGKREEILNIAVAKYPIEYEESTSPISGEVTRKEIENEDRDKLFTNLLWREQIVKITAPNGDVQDGLTIEDVVELRSSLPIAGSGKINEAIEKVRIASAMFIMSVDEDFLAKS